MSGRSGSAAPERFRKDDGPARLFGFMDLSTRVWASVLLLVSLVFEVPGVIAAIVRA